MHVWPWLLFKDHGILSGVLWEPVFVVYVLRDARLSLPLSSPEKALHFSSAWFWMCVLSPTCDCGLARPFPRRSDALPCSWSSQTELARGCGLHTETLPLFKISQDIFLLQFCLKGPHQGIVLFSPRKLVARSLPISAVGMAFIMPFPNHFPKCSLFPAPCWVFWDTETSVWGPGFPFSGRSCEQLRCLKPHFGLMGAGRVGLGTEVVLCDLSVGSQKERQRQGSALPEAIWGPNSTARGAAAAQVQRRRQGRATQRSRGSFMPSAPPAPHAPAAQLRPRPSPLGRAQRRRAGAGEEAAFLQIT